MYNWFYGGSSPSQDELIREAEEKLLELGVKSPYKRHRVRVRENDFLNTVTFEQPSGHHEGELLIAHGFGAGLAYFLFNFDELLHKTKFRIHSIDWLGMGGSSRPDFPYHPEATEEVEDMFVESLEDWRREMKIDKMYVMGHSLGGYLTAVYSMRYPDRVNKLLLVSPAGIPEPDDRWEKLVASRPIGRRMMFSVAAKLWDWNVTPQSVIRSTGPLGRWLNDGYVHRRFGAHLKEFEREALAAYLYQLNCGKASGEYALNTILSVGAWARRPLVKRLHEMKVPTSFFYGAHDWMDKAGAETASKIMSVPTSIHIVEKAGHHLYMDNPKEFNKVAIAELIGSSA
eukprot:comp17483_c0_seq1/m.16984 comp17483_c0_seq1/g.16984  ORF comp17483_c0_seq1/g.16984 comp17483_c0_seq1/m.16984 type:complete len:343 (-) comp17483_c0_seq1:773-1801(-)